MRRPRPREEKIRCYRPRVRRGLNGDDNGGGKPLAPDLVLPSSRGADASPLALGGADPPPMASGAVGPRW